MIRIALALIALLGLAACGGNRQPSASVETSPGGIDFTLVEMPDNEWVSIQIAWPTDWAWREDVNQAAPYVGTQLILAGGAEGYPAGEVGERFADLESEGNLGVSPDHIYGDLTFKTEHMAETVEIANAHLRAPTLDEGWFTRVHDGFAQSMAEAKAQPAQRSFDAARWAVFGDQPLRDALSLDAPTTIPTLTREDVVAWHAQTITRDPEAIVVAGDLDAEKAGAALDALFDGLPEATHDIAKQEEADFSPRRILLHVPAAETTNLTFIAPLPPTRLGGEYEDVIITQALGGGDQSALHEAVRTQLRASYGFGAGFTNYTRNMRILVLSGAVDTERLADAESVVREAYAAFRENGPTGSISDRKAILEENLTEMSEFVFDQAYAELQSALDGFEPGRSLRLHEELAAVSEESILARLAADYPQDGAFLVVAVSPDADALPGACVISAPEEAVDCR
ncbi:M16 family metallopeptidase [Pelagibacterium halotolerans]|uniref:M16 family metallopeptidase n=1 Tax=Pelagibacterium halotolerans TaxID=531813 RepID=UPI00384A56FE